VIQNFSFYQITHQPSFPGKRSHDLEQIPDSSFHSCQLCSLSADFINCANFRTSGNTKDIPTISSLHVTLQLRENLLCILTGGEMLDVFLKKTDKESQMFLTSTLHQPKNAAVFKMAEKAISASENWETDPHIAAVLNSALFHALNLKVAGRKG
jgi:hypothetical protein